MGHPTIALDKFPDPPPHVRIAAIARRQHGLITIVQLRRSGLDDAAVVRRVRAGRLHRVGRGVYAVGHASLSQEGRWLTAVLEAGEGAALSHLAAAKVWEVWRRRVSRIDVVSPRRSSLPNVHRARRLDPRDITRRNGISVTTVARTLVDLTDVLDAHQLANVIHEAAFRDRFSATATRAAMERANGRRRLHLLRAAAAGCTSCVPRSTPTRTGARVRRATWRTPSSRACDARASKSRWSTCTSKT